MWPRQHDDGPGNHDRRLQCCQRILAGADANVGLHIYPAAGSPWQLQASLADGKAPRQRRLMSSLLSTVTCAPLAAPDCSTCRDECVKLTIMSSRCVRLLSYAHLAQLGCLTVDLFMLSAAATDTETACDGRPGSTGARPRRGPGPTDLGRPVATAQRPRTLWSRCTWRRSHLDCSSGVHLR